MMDLETLRFKVETKELEDATTAIDKLSAAVDKLEKPIAAVSAGSKKLTKAATETEAATKKQAQASEESAEKLSKVAQMIEKAGLSLAILRNQTIQVGDDTYKVNDSFTKMQANMLATAKMAGATGDEFKFLASILTATNEAMGVNPFDKSASGLAQLKKEVQEMTQIVNLQADGLALTGKELTAYARDITRVTAAFEAEGKSANDLSAALDKLKTETIQASAEKAKLTQQSKEAEAQIKREASAALDRERQEKESVETTRRNFNYRMQFIEEQQQAEKRAYAESMTEMRKFYAAQEKEVAQASRAIEEQIALQQKLQAQQKYLDQGFSSGASSKAAGMEIKGVPQDVINSFLQQADATEKAARAQRQAAAAANYLTDAERKLDEQLADTNGMHIRYTDQLVRMKTELARSGLSADAAAKKFENLRQKVEAVAAKDKQRELAYLSRAISVQMGDVGISLASGMNPLLVMIQQGDQIRGAIQQVGAEGKVLQDAMKTAAAQIASSFVLTGKAIGGFFLGSIVSAGQAVGNFAKQIPVLGTLPLMFEKAAVNAELASAVVGKNSSAIATGIRAIGTAAAFSTGLLVAFAGIFALALPVALVKAMRQNDEFVRSLTLSGGSMNLTTESAYAFAGSMQQVGATTAQAMQVISEMGKTGNLTASSIKIVTEAAVNLNKYGGVAIEETVKSFSSLAKDPVDALVKIARETGLVSAESIQLVRNLQEQNRQTEAAAQAMKVYADVTSGQIARLKSDYTAFGSFMIELGSKIKGVFNDMVDSMRGLFINPTEMQKAMKNLADAERNRDMVFGDKSKKFWQAQVDSINSYIKKLEDQAKVEADIAAQRIRQVSIDEEGAKFRLDNLSREEKYYKEINRLVARRNEAVSPEAKEGFNSQMVKLAQEYSKAVAVTAEKTKESNQAETEKQRLMKAAEGFIKRIREQTNASIAVQEELNKAEKLRLDILGNEVFKQLPKQTQDQINKLLDQAIATEKLADAELKTALARQKSNADYVELQAKRDKAWFDAMDQSAEYNRSLQEENITLLQQAELIGYSDEARKRAVATRKVELEYAERLSKIQGNSLLTPEQKQEEIVLAAQNYLRALMNVNLSVANDLGQKVADGLSAYRSDIAKALSTALFDGGTKGAKQLRDVILAELRKPIDLTINALVNTLMSGGKGDSVEKLFESFDKSFETIKGIFDGSSTSNLSKQFAEGAEKIGAKLSESSNQFAKSFGGTLQKYSGQIGKSFGMVADILQGLELRETVSGGFSISKGVDTLQKVGIAVGAIIPGFAKIVGAISGVANRLFGRRVEDFGIRGSVSASGFSGEQYQFEKGGLFRSDKTTTSALDSELQTGLSKGFRDLRDSALKMADSLGIGSDVLSSFNKQLNISTKDLTQEQFTAKIQEFFEASSNEMAELILGVKQTITEIVPVAGRVNAQFGRGTEIRYEDQVQTRVVDGPGAALLKDGETATQALERISNSLLVVNAAFDNLGFTLKEVSVAGGAAASDFVDLFGSIEQMTQALNQYYQDFYSEEERIAKTTEQLTRAFAELGLTLPTGSDVNEAKQNYRALVDAAMGAGDEELAAQLIKLSAAFSSTLVEAEKLTEEGEVLSEVLQNLTQEKKNLEIELLKVQGKTTEANAAFRALSTEGMTEAEVAAWDFNAALKEQIAVAEQRKTLEEELNRLTMTTEQIRSAELEAIDEVNRSLQLQIWQLEDAAVAAQAAAQAEAERNAEIARVADERTGLERRLLEVQGDTVTLRALELAALDASNRAILEQIFALEDAAVAAQAAAQAEAERNAEIARIADERLSLERQLLEVQGDTNALRALDLSALDESNRALQQQIWALQDAAVAAQAAAQAEAERSAQLQRIAEERSGLERRLLEVQGDTLALRALEIAALDPSNQALLEQIFALEDQKAAAEAAARAAAEQAEQQRRAAQEIKDAWQNLTDSIFEEVKRIRGLTDQNSASSFAALQAQFATATAQARAGDQAAAAALPELSRALLEMANLQARSLAELRRIEAMTAASLEATGNSLAGAYGLTIPAYANGGSYAGGLALVGEEGPELINFDSPGQVSSAAATAKMMNSANVEQLLNRMNDNIEALRFEVRADVSHNAKTAKLLDRVIQDGETVSVSFLTPQQVDVV